MKGKVPTSEEARLSWTLKPVHRAHPSSNHPQTILEPSSKPRSRLDKPRLVGVGIISDMTSRGDERDERGERMR